MTTIRGSPVRRSTACRLQVQWYQLLRDLDGGALDQVWIALPLRAEARIRELLERLRRYSVQVRFVPDIFNFTLLHHSMTEIAGLPVINLTESPLEGADSVAEEARGFLSLFILLIASPLMLLIAIGVKLSSPGPVFYRQERVTWNGERFRISNSARCRSAPSPRPDRCGRAATKAAPRVLAHSCGARASMNCRNS